MKRMLLWLVMSMLPGLALAAGPVVVNEGDEVDPMEVARMLNPQKFKMRSAKPAAESLALPINFGFGSATVPASASRSLKGFAEGIQLAGAKVLIEGHTDVVGSPDYNRVLSRRRAEAVRDYLASNFGVDRSLIRVTGHGKDRLLSDREPTSAEQRRVEFRPVN